MGWQEKLRNDDVVLIDGGTGSELRRRGVPMSNAAWSGLAAHTHPEAVREVHAAYIDAGADVIITNTFGSARFILEAADLSDEFGSINRTAVALARQARSAAGKTSSEVAIAGSLSNLPPNMDPGQYPDPITERAGLDELAALLADAGVDLIALEMMEDTVHSARAMAAALETGLPVWLGVSCRRRQDGALVSFDAPELELTRILDSLLPMEPAVVNVMHSELAAVPAALVLVRERWAGPIGVYPEIGYTAAPFRCDVTPDEFVDYARGWVRGGARLVGGCCGTSPEHIRALHQALPLLRAER